MWMNLTESERFVLNSSHTVSILFKCTKIIEGYWKRTIKNYYFFTWINKYWEWNRCFIVSELVLCCAFEIASVFTIHGCFVNLYRMSWLTDTIFFSFPIIPGWRIGLGMARYIFTIRQFASIRFNCCFSGRNFDRKWNHIRTLTILSMYLSEYHRGILK